MTDNTANSPTVYQVSELNALAKGLLEKQLAHVWVEGEISNLSTPSSGHAYFSLKDNKAQVRCALFRFRYQAMGFTLQDGMHVVVQAKASIFEGRGDYQLIVDAVEEKGDGALQREFEHLKKKLADQGLFSQEHKKPLPVFPKCVGVITSPTGAVIRDILSVLRRRFTGIPVIVYPTAVQGKAAAPQIVNAIEIANQRKECDVLILARGGGSLEDLWPFNEEIVAHAIFNSTLPIVSAVGHEVDVTIADFVADKRAPTPSVAAELVSPSQVDFWQQLVYQGKRLKQLIENYFVNQKQKIDFFSSRLQHPEQRLLSQAQFLDQLEQRLLRAQSHLAHLFQMKLDNQRNLLQQNNPKPKIAEASNKIHTLHKQLNYQSQLYLKQQQAQLKELCVALDAISPLRTLDRGYAIVTDDQGHVIQAATDVKIGDKVKTRMKKGELLCEVLGKC